MPTGRHSCTAGAAAAAAAAPAAGRGCGTAVAVEGTQATSTATATATATAIATATATQPPTPTSTPLQSTTTTMPPEAEALVSPSRGASSAAAGPQYTARPVEDLKASLLKLHNASGDRNKDAAQLEVIERLVTTPPANANRSHPLGAQPHTAVRAIFSALHGVAMYTAEAAADVRARAPRAVFVYGTLRPDCRSDGDVWRVTTVGDCVWRRGSVRGYQLHQDPAKRYPYAVKTGNNADVRTTKKIKRDANALHIACSKTGWGGGSVGG